MDERHLANYEHMSKFFMGIITPKLPHTAVNVVITKDVPEDGYKVQFFYDGRELGGFFMTYRMLKVAPESFVALWVGVEIDHLFRE